MVKCGVLFEVRTEFLSTTYTIFGFKGLTVTLERSNTLQAFRYG
jgi:hypothetical protein